MKKTFLLLVFALLLTGLLIGGCSEDSIEEDPMADEVVIDDQNPEHVVLAFVEAIKDLDLEKAKSLISSEYLAEFEAEFDELERALEENTAEADIIREMFKIVFNNLDLTITGHTIDGEEAVVSTESTHPDPEILTEELMGRMFEVMLSGDVDLENITEEEGMQLMVEIFSEVYAEVDRITTEADVPMVMEDGQWKIAGEVISDYTIDLDM